MPSKLETLRAQRREIVQSTNTDSLELWKSEIDQELAYRSFGPKDEKMIHGVGQSATKEAARLLARS